MRPQCLGLAYSCREWRQCNNQAPATPTTKTPLPPSPRSKAQVDAKQQANLGDSDQIRKFAATLGTCVRALWHWLLHRKAPIWVRAVVGSMTADLGSPPIWNSCPLQNLPTQFMWFLE